MNLGQAISQVTVKFRQNKLEDAENETVVLFCYLLNRDKASLYADPGLELTGVQLDELDSLVVRRLSHEPTAYIVKHKEFYGIDLYVDSRVLIPRPETEILVEEAIRFARDLLNTSGRLSSELTIADVGTGSGAIAIALAKNIPNAKIYAIDISESALEVASINIQRYGLQGRIIPLECDLLKLVEIPLDMVVANLPYIGSEEISGLEPEIALHEPWVALDGGYDGVQMFGELIKQSTQKVASGGAILLEIGEGQKSKIDMIVSRLLPFAQISFIEDLQGINRVIRIG